MRSYLFGKYIVLIFVNILYSQSLLVNSENSLRNSSKDTSQFKKEYNISFVAGINVTNFQNIESDSKTGFLYGVIYHYNLNESFHIDISGIISRQRIYLKHRQTATLVGNDVHVIFYDSKISFIFLDLPISINYKFWENRTISVYGSLGVGYNAAYSDDTKNVNFIVTDEILNISPPVDEFYDGLIEENSGSYFNIGIGLRYNPVIFKITYIMRNSKLQQIDKTYSLSFQLGYSF